MNREKERRLPSCCRILGSPQSRFQALLLVETNGSESAETTPARWSKSRVVDGQVLAGIGSSPGVLWKKVDEGVGSVGGEGFDKGFCGQRVREFVGMVDLVLGGFVGSGG